MNSKFKTAADLDITAEEHAGLIQIMEHFRSRPPEHVRSQNYLSEQDFKEPRAGTLGFTMDYPLAAVVPGTEDEVNPYHCGTVACIGGHLSLHLQGLPVTAAQTFEITPEHQAVADQYVMERQYGSPLSPLFYPPVGEIYSGCWHRLTPVAAADAIENFLKTGKPAWAEVSAARDLRAHHSTAL